jgi:DNA polymerase III sliding clamp (beta) subunit (PCNA family)
LHYTRFAAHKTSNNILQGILVSFSGKSFEMIATDGTRLSLYQNDWSLFACPEPFQFVISSQSLDILEDSLNRIKRILGDFDITFHASGNFVTVHYSDFSYPIQIWNHQIYPNVKALIPSDFPISIEFERRTFIAGIQEYQLSVKGETSIISFEFMNNSALIYHFLPDGEPKHHYLPVKYVGDSFKITFNMSYLLDYLQRCHSHTLALQTRGALYPTLIRGEDFVTYLIMPIDHKIPVSV